MNARADGFPRLLKATAPTLIGLAGVLLLALPLRLFYDAVPTPIVPLIVVYFWSLYAPDYLPSPCVLGIGLAQDLLTGGPLGLYAAVYLVTQYIVLSQRSYFINREHTVVWVGFAFAAAGATLILWLATSLLAGAVLHPGRLILQMFITVLVYVPFSIAFSGIHRRVVSED